MRSQRCTMCAVNYPTTHSECMRCGGPLRPSDGDVSPDWADVPVGHAGSETMKVEMWRLRVLVDAGYTIADAEKLATAHHVDVHQAVDLLGRGCEPATAAQILL